MINRTTNIMQKLILTAILFFCTFFIHAQIFNNNLSADEKARLENGEVLVRNIGNAKKISLNEINKDAESVISTVKALKPPYLVEIIQKIPYEGNEQIFDILRKELTDVESYVGIPYFGQRTQRWYDLYSSAVVLSKAETAETSNILANLEMSPFGIITTNIDIVQKEDMLLYSSNNTEPVKIQDSGVKIVDGMTCAKANAMKSFVYAFREGDSIILYGLGGVNAPNVIILKDKIDNSFINRVTTFCKYIFSKL